METMVVAVFCCRNESLHMRFLSVGGGMGIMSVFFGENENKLVLSCELRSGPVWVIFFPIISGTLHPHLCDYDQLAQPMSACEDLGMQRDEDRHFSSGGKTIG